MRGVIVAVDHMLEEVIKFHLQAYNADLMKCAERYRKCKFTEEDKRILFQIDIGDMHLSGYMLEKMRVVALDEYVPEEMFLKVITDLRKDFKWDELIPKTIGGSMGLVIMSMPNLISQMKSSISMMLICGDTDAGTRKGWEPTRSNVEIAHEDGETYVLVKYV